MSTKYEENLQRCLRKESEEWETIFHSIVNCAYQRDSTDRKMRPLAELSSKPDPSLIEARLRTNGDPALHIFIRMNSEISEQFMCATSATSCLHVDQENCLHLVIKLRIRVAEYLIEKANVITFTAKRMRRKRTETSRQSLSELGNTPLHDAVDFQNGKIYKNSPVVHIEKSQAMPGD